MMKSHLFKRGTFCFLMTACLCLMNVINLQGTNISVSGAISTPVTWSADTVKVTGNVTVDNGVILTVNPGVKVIFQGHYMLNVQGSIRAAGTAAQPILFTIGDTTGFTNMTIPGGGWAGIRLDSTLSSNDSSVFRYCHFMYTKAVGTGDFVYGGAMFVYNFGKLLVQNSSFDYCRASSDGGAIYLKNAGGLIAGNTFAHGKSTRGAGIFCDNSPVRMERNNFSQNYATSMGGGICVATGSSPVIINNLFGNNLAFLGGGIAFFNAGGSVKLISNTIVFNHANYGGGISSIGTDASVVNTIFWGNDAADGHEVTLLDTVSDPAFSYCNIQGGLTEFGGSGSGAAYNGSYSNNLNAYPDFKDTLLYDYQIASPSPCKDAGTPDTTGLKLPQLDLASNPRINMGRIDIGAYERQQVVTACGSIAQNTLWNADTVKVTCDITVEPGVTLTIEPGVYVEFQGAYKMEVNGYLHALGAASAEITFAAENTATRWLGIHLLNTAPADSSVLQYCNVSWATNLPGQDGGAIQINGLDAVRISHCTLEDNLSSANGGAVALFNASPIIENTSISGNTAVKGGGLFISTGSAPVLSRLTIMNNNASEGAGMFFEKGYLNGKNLMLANNVSAVSGGALQSDSAILRLVNCIFVNNEGGSTGGTLSISRSDLVLNNSNIVNNNSQSAAVVIDSSDLEMNNCILYGNKINSSANGEVYVADTNCMMSFRYCDIEGDSTAFGYVSEASFEGTYANNLDVTPGFVNPTAGAGSGYDGFLADWSLDACSPLFNAGTPVVTGLNLPSFDFALNERIFADTVDMGAYELIKPVITAAPHDTAVCAGNDVYFAVTTESTIPVSYQWQVKPAGSGSFVNAAGPSATTANYTVSAVTSTMNGDQYQCIISAACSGDATTTVADLTVYTAPSVQSQPASLYICQGSTATFTVGATGSNLSYQWQQRPFGSSTWSNCTGTGATTSAYSIPNVPPAINNYSYRCLINGSCLPGDTTDIATLTVKSLPAIVTQPTNQSLCIGEDASFTVTGSGAGITYQWQESTDGGTTWNDMTGSTSTSISLTAVPYTMNGYKYRCVVTGECNPPATSNAATLTVNTSPQILIQPNVSDVCLFSNVNISVQASGGNLTYQWQQKGPADTDWSNAPGLSALTANYQILNITLAQDGYKYRCQISGSCPPPVITDSVTLHVHNIPSFYVGPDTTMLLSHTITLDAGTGFTGYLWSTGATTQTIDVVGTDAGIGSHSYSCTVTDAFGCSNNDALIVTVVDDAGIEAVSDKPVFEIMPNPATDAITISCGQPTAGPWQVSLLDMTGKSLLVTRYEMNSDAVIDLSAYPAGLYFVQIQNNKNIYRYILNILN